MIRMVSLINLPAFNQVELHKVMADTRLTAFKKTNESNLPKVGVDAQDQPPATGMVTSGAEETETLPMEKTQKLFQALKLQNTKISPEEFHKGMNVEMEHANVVGGNLKKIALLVLAHLKKSPTYYSDETQKEATLESTNPMLLRNLMK
jgi:hypothetical protein